MKTLQALPLCVFIITLLTGCSASKKAEDGDPEANIGEYRVGVSPPEADVHSYRGTGLDPITVKLSAQCSGPFLPVDCAIHAPNWTYSASGKDGFPGSIAIADPNSPNTTATIRFDLALLKTKRIPERSSVPPNVYTERVTFRPTTPPNDLVVVGRDWIELKIFVSEPSDERQELNPNEPRLKVLNLSQQTLSFVLNLKDESQTLTAPLVYTGLGTTITIAGPSDLGTPGGAEKFTLLTPSTISLPGDGTQPPPLQVKFQVDPIDVLKTYTAALYITVGNSRTIPVRLQGRRESF